MTQQNEKTLSDYISAFKRRKWQMILPAMLIFSIALAIALSLPAVYRSQATILIERQNIPTDLVRTTVTGYADEQVQLLSQQVMTTDNLLGVIKKYDLYKVEREDSTTEEILSIMRSATVLEMVSADVVDPRSGRPGQATIAFMLSYESKSPSLAQKVTNELVTLYLNENLKSRSEKAAQASGFLADEANRLSEKLQLLEKKLAHFKEENINQLPELTSLNLQLLQRTEQEVAEIKREISLREERKIYLQSELAQMSPNKMLVMPSGERVMGSEDRLKALEMEYLRVVSAYKADHPDVVKLKREIQLLRSELGGGIDQQDYEKQLMLNREKLAELKQQYELDHPEVQNQERIINALIIQRDNTNFAHSVESSIKPDNPAFIQLKAQLEATESEVASLKRRLTEKATDLKAYEIRLIKTPQVEREYRQLSRDYENVSLKYREISGKQIEAELAEQLEKESKGDRLSLIEPPLLPEKAAKPNRLAIIFLGFVFAIGGGIGLVAILESLDRKVRGRGHVAAILGEEPLVMVPYMPGIDEQRNATRMKSLVLAVILILGIGILLGIHYFYKPLDVLWFVVLNKIS